MTACVYGRATLNVFTSFASEHPILYLYTEKVPTAISRNFGCARHVRLGSAFLKEECGKSLPAARKLWWSYCTLDNIHAASLLEVIAVTADASEKNVPAPEVFQWKLSCLSLSCQENFFMLRRYIFLGVAWGPTAHCIFLTFLWDGNLSKREKWTAADNLTRHIFQFVNICL